MVHIYEKNSDSGSDKYSEDLINDNLWKNEHAVLDACDSGHSFTQGYCRLALIARKVT